jgi:uncharacterized membrane protein YfcA
MPQHQLRRRVGEWSGSSCFGRRSAASVSGAAGFGGALLLLPLLTHFLGPEAAVPVLTVAQLLGNLSRAGFGFREVRWRPTLAFSAGAIPATVLGARLFVELPSSIVMRLIGFFLILVIVLRHTTLGKRPVPEQLLPPAGGVVGFLSAVVGSAGPLGAAVFLSLQLPAVAYVASEAVTAFLIHLTKSAVYSRYEFLTWSSLGQGLLLGSAMVLGSWTGRRFIERVPEKWFGRLVEALLLLAAISLIVG